MPLANSETVFRTTATILGERITRMPDGETGARGDWVQWLTHLVRRHPQFELPGGAIDYSAPRERAHYYRVKPGIDPASVDFGELGYAEHARESYRGLCAAQYAEGVDPDSDAFAGGDADAARVSCRC